MTKGKQVERICAVCRAKAMVTPKNGYIAPVCQKCHQKTNTFNGVRR